MKIINRNDLIQILDDAGIGDDDKATVMELFDDIALRPGGGGGGGIDLLATTPGLYSGAEVSPSTDLAYPL